MISLWFSSGLAFVVLKPLLCLMPEFTGSHQATRCSALAFQAVDYYLENRKQNTLCRKFTMTGQAFLENPNWLDIRMIYKPFGWQQKSSVLRRLAISLRKINHLDEENESSGKHESPGWTIFRIHKYTGWTASRLLLDCCHLSEFPVPTILKVTSKRELREPMTATKVLSLDCDT